MAQAPQALAWPEPKGLPPLCVRRPNGIFATQQVESVNNRGEKVYVKDANGSVVRDTHGHFIVAHDLFNHDGLTKDGVAEAFAEFAKKEGLSFFR